MLGPCHGHQLRCPVTPREEGIKPLQHSHLQECVTDVSRVPFNLYACKARHLHGTYHQRTFQYGLAGTAQCQKHKANRHTNAAAVFAGSKYGCTMQYSHYRASEAVERLQKPWLCPPYFSSELLLLLLSPATLSSLRPSSSRP